MPCPSWKIAVLSGRTTRSILNTVVLPLLDGVKDTFSGNHRIKKKFRTE